MGYERAGDDGAELLMTLEEAFDIRIPDQVSGRFVTVGDLHTYLVGRLREKGAVGGEACLTARAFYRVRRAVADQLGLERRALRPATRLEVILPPSERRRLWPRLERTSGLAWPALQRPVWLATTMLFAVLTAIVVAHVWCYQNWWGSPGVSALVYVAIPAEIAVVVGLAMLVTRPLATCLKGCETLGDVARIVLAKNLRRLKTGQTLAINEQEVWDILVSMVSDQISVHRKEITPQMQFVEDLGFD
jgi:acyl carrier protein